MALLLLQPVAVELVPGPAGGRPFLLLLGSAAVVLALFAAAPPWLARARLPAVLLLVGLHFALGVWILDHARPGGDVYLFQGVSIRALHAGIDPYTLTFRNIYHPYEGFYGPGLVVNGRLQFGYPYPPLPLFLVSAALPFGDIRYAHLAALSASGALLALVRPGRLGPLAAGLLLFNPRFGLVVQMGWTEPLLILFLALTVFCTVRAPRLTALAFGLLLACKQYLVLLLPAAALLVPGPADERRRRTIRLLGMATLVVLVVSLPLALWHPSAFVHSAVTLQFFQPFRVDALTFLAPLADVGGRRLTWLPGLLGPLAVALALWRLPRSPAGFAAAVALIFLVFFAFNKQAFCNYYLFVIGALCAAVAAVDSRLVASHRRSWRPPRSCPHPERGRGSDRIRPMGPESAAEGLAKDVVLAPPPRAPPPAPRRTGPGAPRASRIAAGSPPPPRSGVPSRRSAGSR